MAINRRSFLRLAATTVVGGLTADGVLIEANFPRVVKKEIRLQRWPERMDGFTVALLSDFHFDPYFSVHPLRAAVAKVNELHPQLIALTGDFVSVPVFGDPEEGAAMAEPCAQLLRRMRAPFGLWAVMGNHDAFTDPDRVTSALRASGIKVLANESTAIEANGGRFWLGGVDDVLGRTADLDGTLHDIPSGEATILLAHEPDYADRVRGHPIDLQLSGHTHGGQVRVPLIRPSYLPELGRKYVRGLYKVGGLTLYTNPGMGTVGVPVRFNCPPEITLMTIRRG